jgi:ferric enterobactin transport system permease protein
LGAALAASGAIFQSLLRNPLGSPDVIGFNTGAYSGVLVAIVLFNGGDSRVSPSGATGRRIADGRWWFICWRGAMASSPSA